MPNPSVDAEEREPDPSRPTAEFRDTPLILRVYHPPGSEDAVRPLKQFLETYARGQGWRLQVQLFADDPSAAAHLLIQKIDRQAGERHLKMVDTLNHLAAAENSSQDMLDAIRLEILRSRVPTMPVLSQEEIQRLEAATAPVEICQRARCRLEFIGDLVEVIPPLGTGIGHRRWKYLTKGRDFTKWAKAVRQAVIEARS